MIDFSLYAPQQGFLVQGNQNTFDGLIASISKKDPLVQGLAIPRFTIEHARTVAEFLVEGTGEQRTFLVYFSVFSPDAAQVLLKSLEEPAKDTIVVFITDYPYLVPKTVRSRLMMLSVAIQTKEKNEYKKIIDALKKEASEKEDDPAVRRARAVALLDTLEQSIRSQHAYVRVLYEAKAMLFKANMPTKYVLDYVTTVIR